jgi:hypothetical protein
MKIGAHSWYCWKSLDVCDFLEGEFGTFRHKVGGDIESWETFVIRNSIKLNKINFERKLDFRLTLKKMSHFLFQNSFNIYISSSN